MKSEINDDKHDDIRFTTTINDKHDDMIDGIKTIDDNLCDEK